MPQYYFDIRAGSHCLPDTDGAELPTLRHAEQMARQIVEEIAREVPRRNPRTVLIEILNEDRQRESIVGCDDVEKVGRRSTGSTSRS